MNGAHVHWLTAGRRQGATIEATSQWRLAEAGEPLIYKLPP
jgi:hypothetical protein